HERDDLGAGRSSLDVPGPARDERHPNAALVVGVFAAAQNTVRMVAHSRLSGQRTLVVTVGNGRTIVAREDDERIALEPLLLQRRHQARDLVVELHHGITAGANTRLAEEARIWIARHMRLVRGVIEKEALVLVRTDEFARVRVKGIGERLVVPQRGLAT